MDRQASPVEVVRLVAQQVEKLGVHERRHKIEGAVRIREDDEQRRFAVAQGVQLQLVLRHEVPQFLNVKGRQAGAAANQYAFQSFARDEKSRTFSSNSKRSHILRTSSRSIRLILSSIVSLAVS